MATMIRPRGKAQKIFYSVMGKPTNAPEKKTKKERHIDQLLASQDTRRMR